MLFLIVGLVALVVSKQNLFQIFFATRSEICCEIIIFIKKVNKSRLVFSIF